MLHNIAMRTEEFVACADSHESADMVELACEGRIHLGHCNSMPLCALLDSRSHHAEKPLIQLAPGAFAYVLLLSPGLKAQVFQNDHSIWRNPLTELGSGFSTEGQVSVVVCPGQPLQHSAYRSGIRVLCLLPGELGLQAGASLAKLGVSDSQAFSIDKESIRVGGSYQCVVDPEVNAYGNSAYRLGHLQCDA